MQNNWMSNERQDLEKSLVDDRMMLKLIITE
jgi:hypothetical protein